MTKRKCVVCDERPHVPEGTLCDECNSMLCRCDSYAEQIREAARRARAYERRRWVKMLKSWLDKLDNNKEPKMLYEADVALRLRDMISGRAKR